MNIQAKHKRILAITGICIGVLAILGALFFLWVYTATLSDTSFAVLKGLRLPIGKVGSKRVTIQDLEPLSPTLLKPVIVGGYFEKYAESKKYSEILKKYNPKPVTSIRDITSLDALKIWWNGNDKLNPRYKEIKGYEQRLSQGRNIQDLARLYSEDSATKAFGGDAGFIEIGEAQAEFAQEITGMQKGDYKIVPTRYGLELVYIDEVIQSNEGKKLYHIYHLTLKEKGFDAWLKQEQEKIPVKTYIKMN